MPRPSPEPARLGDEMSGSRAAVSATGTMAAVVVRRHGGPDVLELTRIRLPRPSAGEALIEIRACGINHQDIWAREGQRGRQDMALTLPRVLGSDIAGIVREVGESYPPSAPPIGAAVVTIPARGCGRCGMCIRGRENACSQYSTLGIHRDGGYAEFVVVPAEDIIPMPEHLDFVEAACLPLAYMTAWHMLVSKAHVRPGETVLINAAASGVGSAAVQVASGLGARVIAAASSSEKLEKARQMGADEAVQYAPNVMWPEVMRLTDGRGVDIVVDSVGSNIFEQSLRAAAMGGRIVNCGATAGEDVHLDLHAVRGRRLELYFSVMGSRADLYESLDFVRRGRRRPLINRTIQLAHAQEAYRAMAERAMWGKVVLAAA